MYTIINNPVHLSTNEMTEFTRIFHTGRYSIITSMPSQDNVPELLTKTLQDRDNYCMILDDPQARFNYFAINYNTTRGEMIVPVGAYGVSDKRQVLFPLVINGTWQVLLMLGKSIFCKACGLADDEAGELYYARLVEWKKQFIHNIFRYYHSFRDGYCAAMAWPVRGTRSDTRTIAESLAFHRSCINGKDREMELYSSKTVDEDSALLKYFKNCLFRWEVVGREELRAPEDIHPNTVTLIKSIVQL